MLWRFMTDDEIALTNNEGGRALRGYVLWRKGSYGVWISPGRAVSPAHPVVGGDRQTVGRCPQEWLRAVVRACIEDRLSHPGRTDAVNPVPGE